jgi:hypothetical protein
VVVFFFNSDRLALTLWLLFTIAFAITIGYLYSGKSWCNYFCPMATVQNIYSEPGGLFTSHAHTSEELITQSMCRTTLPDGKEKSACVACQNPCIDIDSERTYWADLKRPDSSFLRYGYVGLVIGYFIYYYLYAGNWDYYFSGIWARETDQLASLFAPGFYVLGKTVNIPKIVAVPMTLGGFTALSYGWGKLVEKTAKAYSLGHHLHLSRDTIRHRIFTISTFEIYVLAKVLPGFTKHKLYQAYKGVAREFLVEGKMKYSQSLDVLQTMAQELEITEDEHWEILNQLGIENVEMINSPVEIQNVENHELLQKLQDLSHGWQKHLEKIIYVPTKYTDLVSVKYSLQKFKRSQEKEE